MNKIMEPTNKWKKKTKKKNTNLGEILDGVFVGVADVDGKVVVAVHQGNEAPHQIVHVLERSCLRPVT